MTNQFDAQTTKDTKKVVVGKFYSCNNILGGPSNAAQISERREFANLASYLGKERERSATFLVVVTLYASSVLFYPRLFDYLGIRQWWLPTGGHLLEKGVTFWVTYSPAYVTVGG